MTEEQLLNDGRLWLTRAAELYTRTPKIKIWVPVVCSILLTSYYIYTLHAKAIVPAELSPVAVQSPAVAVAVADDAPAPKGPSTAVPVPAESSASAPDSESDSDLLKRAQQAHVSQQFAVEAGLLQKVLDHSHSPQQVCPAIGKAYEHAGEIDSAIQAFEQCVSGEPDNVDTLAAFAHTLQAKPDYKRATALYRECLQKDPGNLDAQTGLALIELKQNRLHEANDDVLAILHKSPDNTDALLIAGIVAWRQSRLADAERIFSRGIGLDDRRADFHAFLGRIAEAQRRPREALEQYQKALLLDPNDGEIADRRDRLQDLR